MCWRCARLLACLLACVLAWTLAGARLDDQQRAAAAAAAAALLCTTAVPPVPPRRLPMHCPNAWAQSRERAGGYCRTHCNAMQTMKLGEYVSSGGTKAAIEGSTHYGRNGDRLAAGLAEVGGGAGRGCLVCMLACMRLVGRAAVACCGWNQQARPRGCAVHCCPAHCCPTALSCAGIPPPEDHHLAAGAHQVPG